MKKSLFSVWEGVFKNFSEAGGNLDAFDSDIWIDKQKQKISQTIDDYKKDVSFSKDYPLPLIVSMALSQKEKISVLDFGGGMGAQYLEVIGKVPSAEEKIKYVIVDGEKTLQNTPSFMKKFKNLSYFSDTDTLENRFDIIHIGSTLQYIEEWETLLGSFIKKFNPQYLVFSDLMAGDIPTFVSHQIFYEKKIPHMFLNLKNFCLFLKKLNFSLIFKANFIRITLDQEKIFPNFGLPKTHQIQRPINVVFMKEKSKE